MANSTFLICGVLVSVVIIACIGVVDSQSSSGEVCYDATGNGLLLKQLYQMRVLRNCRVYVGTLIIAIIRTDNEEEKRNISFPILQEITGALVFSLLRGGKDVVYSPSEIFPNLRVIRGNQFFYGSALVFYFNSYLKDLALPKLTKIVRGGVRLQNNGKMCYYNTLKWSSLMGSSYTSTKVITKQLASNCKTCDSECNGYCWSEHHCQITCDECGDVGCDQNGRCVCPPGCLGGCESTANEKKCYACNTNYYNYQGKCFNSCPRDTYELEGHCLNECVESTYQYKNTCVRKCPVGWTENTDRKRCDRCENCPRVCQPIDVEGDQMTISAIDHLLYKLKGCTVLDGNLIIRIAKGSGDIVKELESALGDIREITGYLQIVSTPSIVSLKFLKSLKKIHGRELAASNDGKGYAMSILYNNNIENLWDENTKFQIVRGKLFFHSNPRLCYEKIIKFAKSIGHENVSSTDVSLRTNGDQVQCKMIPINITTFQPDVKYDKRRIHLTIGWVPINYLDIGGQNQLVYYEVYYRETSSKNITIYDGADACGSQVWQLITVPPARHSTTIKNLKANTKYAVYVKILTIGKIGARSEIEYYEAPDLQPTRVQHVENFRFTSSIRIKWGKPAFPNGKNITYKIVYQQMQEEDVIPEAICKGSRADMDLIHDLPIEGTPTPTTKVNSNCSCSITTATPTVDPLDNIDIHKEDQTFYEYISELIFPRKTPPPTTISTANATTFLPTTLLPSTTEPTTLPTTLPTTQATRVSTTGKLTSRKPTTSKPIISPIIIFESDTSITLRNLTSFTKYKIIIIPCNSQCPKNSADSTYELYGIRTLPERGRDNVTNVTVKKAGSSGYNVSWTPPINPNGGLVLAYEIRYKRYENKEQYNRKMKGETETEQYKCHSAGVNASNSHLISLTYGFYVLDVSAVTFAGRGYWIGNVTMDVAEIRNDAVTIGVSVGGAIAVIVIIGICTWYFLRRRYIRQHKQFVESINPDYLNAADVYVPDEWEFERDKVKLLNELGKGAFGMVYLGEATGITIEEPKSKVAVKTVNENADFKTRHEFLNEACIMKQFDCNHIVRLLGIVSKGTPPLVIMELMLKGDLKTYLRSLREDPDNPDYYKKRNPKRPSDDAMHKIAAEIADGILYLSDKKFVHRDLAARNCMVNEDLTVKIGDFGLTRDVYNCDYYRKGGKGMLPVRWMPPESLRDGIYTTAADVWSFGIVLWEIATLAEQPYPGRSNEEVLQFVLDGGTVDRPPFCSDILYRLIVNCTQFQAKLRPTCRDIVSDLLPLIPPSFKKDAYYCSKDCKEIAMKNGIGGSSENIEDKQPTKRWPDGMDDASLPSQSESSGHKSRSSTGENDHTWRGDTSSNKYVVMDMQHGGRSRIENIIMSRLRPDTRSQEYGGKFNEISKSTPCVTVASNAMGSEPNLTGYGSASMRNVNVSRV